MHAFKPSTVLGRQRQVGVDLRVQGQPGLQGEFQDSQSYTENHVESRLKKRKKQKEQTVVFPPAYSVN